MRTARRCALPAFAALFVVILSIVFLHTTAVATSVVPMNDEQLVAAAGAIVLGTVERVESSWNEEHTQIFTAVRITVSESLKGLPTDQNTVTITVIGGRVGDRESTLIGAPRFAPGDEVVLFIDKNAQAVVPIVGMAQGKVDIIRDPATGARRVEERGVSADTYLQNIRDIVAAQEQGGAR